MQHLLALSQQTTPLCSQLKTLTLSKQDLCSDRVALSKRAAPFATANLLSEQHINVS